LNCRSGMLVLTDWLKTGTSTCWKKVWSDGIQGGV
jgi:hypothetical protein